MSLSFQAAARGRVRSLVASAVLVALLPGTVGAQTLLDEGRALEFRTDLPWARLDLSGRESVDGVSPLRVPGFLEGEYWLSAWGPGVELQRGRVRVKLDEGGSRIASYGRRPFSETLAYSVLYPGIIQRGQQQRGKSLFLGLAATAGLVGTAIAQNQLWNAEEDVDVASRATSTDAEVAAELKNVLQDRREDRDHAADRRNIVLAATGAVWGVGLLDAFLFSPGFRVTSADESSISLSMQSKTRFDAVVRSIVFPGLGQEYNGESAKGAWVATGAVAGGLWLMYRQDEYSRAIADFDQVHERFEAATTVADRNRLSLEQQALFSEVEDQERDRNVAMVILGAYWGVAAIETALSFGEAWGDRTVRQSGVGLSLDPSRGAVAAQWKF
ncbi:MAG: hypothetical protein DHS20C21_23280 [Gemmatimonadota bacterium]|nr:MAG: hypothetical protein DHS20C21_23280 [Gemmatimonadota bacterium]